MPDTLSQIRTRVKLGLGNKENIDSTIDEAINEAILQLIQEAQPEEVKTTATFVTASGQSSYTFASDISATDVLAITAVRNNTDDVELEQGSELDFNRQKQDTSVAGNLGEPTLWYRDGAAVVLYSLIPNSTSRTIKLTYLQRPTRLSADADTFPLNDEWKRPVEQLAKALVALDLGNSGKAEGYLAAYRTMLGFRDVPSAIEDRVPDAQVIPVSNPFDTSAP